MEKENLYLIDKIKGVGPKIKKELNKLNIRTTYDLVRFFPHSFEQFKLEDVSSKNNLQVITFKVKIISDLKVTKYNNKVIVMFSVLTTNNLILKATAFNQEFLNKTYKQDDVVYIKGKLEFYNKKIVINKVININSFETIKPKYNLENIKDGLLHKVFNDIFENNKVNIYENLPYNIINKYNLISRYQSFSNIHLVKSINDYNDAIKRMKFEEAYLFQKELVEKINKRLYRQKKEYDINKVRDYINTIPYELTSDQKSAVNDIFKDFKKEEVGYRLIQGDVGSGKTVVASIGIYGAILANNQVALMAPTELLANQHFETMKELFKDLISIELLTSDTKNKNEIKERLEEGKIDLIIGTHALVSDNVKFKNLGLIVIDEQHKFGVSTRNTLIKKSEKADLIYLTATPIPRTLAISLFGEADISVIKEKPVERKKVLTKVLLDKEIDIVIDEIKRTLKRDEKVYVVVPAISSNHAIYNIENVYELLSKKFDQNLIYQVHGKVKKNEQTMIMNKFKDAKKGILLATTMIEVGINIKEATLMVIFSADYFGLSQLHQLRGRVGRGTLESKCLLITSNLETERLKIIENENDGFKLSEHDLKLRGPGHLLGLEQSGKMKFNFLDFTKDYEILFNMRNELLKKVK